ncbi:MAG: hypothetical protein WA635_03600, partial [Gallionella sp.]
MHDQRVGVSLLNSRGQAILLVCSSARNSQQAGVLVNCQQCIVKVDKIRKITARKVVIQGDEMDQA